MAASVPTSGNAVVDRLAVVGLCGVFASAATWAVLSWMDSALTSTALLSSVLVPTPQEQVLRLSAMVLVLTSTFLIQTLYGRHLKMRNLLLSEQARVRQMYDRSPEAILTVDADMRLLYTNPRADALAGRDTANTLGSACHSAVYGCEEPCQDCPALKVFDTAEVFQRTIANEVGGKRRWLEQVFFPVLDSEGKVTSVVESIRDTTAARLAQSTMQRMAFYDPLTDLPNRALFMDRLESALLRARRAAETLAVVFVDLDDFKDINDKLGHGVGDATLRAVSERLSELLRADDTVARQGGDEFTIISRVACREDASLVAQRVLAVLAEGFVVEGHGVLVSASVGIATYPEDAQSAAELVKHADVAMYEAKSAGRNIFRFYEAGMDRVESAALKLEEELRAALSAGEFELVYQPQVDIRTGGCVGVEALLRWRHPKRGVLAPGAFLEVAERAGLIGEIDRWVLRTACAQGREWLDLGVEFGRVAVNVSAREFVQSHLVENVARVLEATGFDPTLLELEITESTGMYNFEQVVSILELLRDMGVRVAIDDFGTGYSSIGYLRRFPVQTLKIAQDFVRDVDVNTESGAIATTIIALCRKLKLDLVAEGVETEEQLRFLTENGCHVIQGYLLSKPVDADELPRIIGSAHWKPQAKVAHSLLMV